jgi:hypothetical protein
MLPKLLDLRDRHLKLHEINFYPYQREFSDRIIEALVNNYQIIQRADPEAIKKMEAEEIPVEFSRQAGKTTALVHTVDFLLTYWPLITKKDFAVGIFAPQREQAKTDFDRLKRALQISGRAFRFEPIEANAQTLRLETGGIVAECYIFPVTPTSKPESKTLHLMIFEEAQELADSLLIPTIFPIGAATNAPRIYIGTAGTRICRFYRLITTGQALVYDYREIIRQRREQYERDRNVEHLVYEAYVTGEKVKLGGEDADDFRRPYGLQWIIGTGQFLTWELFNKLVGAYSRSYQGDKTNECFVGIDTAKNPDSTIVTVLRYNRERRRKEIINWLELKGDNYQDQFDIITGWDSKNGRMTDQGFLSKYKVRAVAVDSTGQGDFMPDLFERHTQWQDANTGLYRVKFSLQQKDILYKNLLVQVRELLTAVPRIETKEAERFQQQLLDLQREYRGELLSCHHPDAPDAHDDYADSWALAEYAYLMHTQNNTVSLHVLESPQEQPTAERLSELGWGEPEPQLIF